MTKMENMLYTFFARITGSAPVLESEEGQTLAEYAMILALIALIVVVAVGVLGGTINGIFQQINSQI